MKLFLDDIRFPPKKKNFWAALKSLFFKENDNFVIARSVDEAVAIVTKNGFPDYISFDHDLGENSKTGHDFAKWLVNYDLDTGLMPENFSYYIHSANPVGAENIKGLLDQYLEYKRR